MKGKIRPIYQELQGYLSQAPIPDKGYQLSRRRELMDQLNQTIDELNEISGRDYGKFKVSISPGFSDRFSIEDYRSKLGGLIDRLHAEYFSDDPRPFGGSPTTIITQSQAQEQSTQIVMLLEVQEKILERLQDNQIGPTEKRFLEKLKDNLSGVRSAIELFHLILITARDTGLDLVNLTEIFK